jgi:hypothetical protein
MSGNFSANVPVDPLQLIRNAYRVRETDQNPFAYCTSNGSVLEALTRDCTHITVATSPTSCAIFPRAVATNYRSKRGAGPHYPLDSICFLLERKDDSYTNYLQDVRRLGFTVVSLPDKRELVEYLTMANEDGQYGAVDRTAELPLPLLLFPESLEALREQEQKTQFDGPSARESAGESAGGSDVKKSVDASLVRPIQTTETLFHCKKVSFKAKVDSL